MSEPTVEQKTKFLELAYEVATKTFTNPKELAKKLAETEYALAQVIGAYSGEPVYITTFPVRHAALVESFIEFLDNQK